MLHYAQKDGLRRKSPRHAVTGIEEFAYCRWVRWRASDVSKGTVYRRKLHATLSVSAAKSMYTAVLHLLQQSRYIKELSSGYCSMNSWWRSPPSATSCVAAMVWCDVGGRMNVIEARMCRTGRRLERNLFLIQHTTHATSDRVRRYSHEMSNEIPNHAIYSRS